MGKLTFHAQGRARSLATLVGVIVLCVGGCTDAPEDPSPSPSPTTTAAEATQTEPGRAEHVPGKSVTKAPQQVNDGEVLLSVASRSGSAELPLTKKIGVGLLAIQVNCQGEGTLEITIDPTGISFPLECVEKEVSSTYNEIHLKRARAEGTVRVKVPSDVRWALTVEQ
ncbi:hypothetical protein ACIRFF_32395 [Streptomyces cyaneofuscatus]